MPPRQGRLDVNAWSALAPAINGYKTEPWLLKQAKVLHVAIEVDAPRADALVPPAMQPAIPTYVTFYVGSYPESPVGPFSIAEVRVMGRAGVRPRGFVLRSFVDSDAARRELAARWGYPVAPGEIHLHLRHDRVHAQIAAEGKSALEIEMLDREVISGGDVQYVASMHLARNQQDQKLSLVQVDPEFVFSRAERGRPRLLGFDQTLWSAGGHLEFTNPISASFTVCDVTLPKIRYICDPERPALFGTTRLAA